ncbi:MAG: bifunctional (p)ppGpp synthetase/guanosine-3',5'-bis(diphosphate) 3'-pyrophosphohydrolase [Gammaproteobacteria bacterium]
MTGAILFPLSAAVSPVVAMVTIEKQSSCTVLQPRHDINAWLRRLAADGADIETVRHACSWLEDVHGSQSPTLGLSHWESTFSVANILVDLRLDHESIAAALIYKLAQRTPALLPEIEANFGERIAILVKGLTQMSALTGTLSSTSAQKAPQVEGVRKMLLAMAQDARVVIIKLAERLQELRTLHILPLEAQPCLARETIDIFAPLANRLGIWQMKWELEDLSFRCLEPRAYKDLALRLAERRIDRERYIERFIDRLQVELKHAGIDAKITGRPKHILGIWRKMKRTGQGFHEIYDQRAVRILVNEVSDCYAALSVVYALWPYLPEQFDDYIATPKENNYRSIHTAVIGPEEKVIEVQIRTHEMHQQAELGIAAHWRYKDKTPEDPSFDLKIAWLRQLLEWKAEIIDSNEWLEPFKPDIFQDRVYILTPRGKVLDLPQGATPLDFAYHIHTEIGHRCRGAKVNGRIVPLSYRLNTSEQVEILTVKKGRPSRDWINPHLGYLKTRKARSKVQQWFRQLDYDRNVADGRTGLERELKRLGYAAVGHDKLAQRLNYKRTNDLFAAIGRGDIKPPKIINAVQDIFGYDRSSDTLPPDPAPSTTTRQQTSSGIRVQGVGNLVTRLAGCCHPVPGDAIVGYITRGYGVTIHRHDCRKVLACANECPERLAEVSWNIDSHGSYPVEVQIIAFNRHGLLRDITTVLTNEKLNVTATHTHLDKDAHTATLFITFEIPDITTLNRALARIQQLPDVFQVRRAIY